MRFFIEEVEVFFPYSYIYPEQYQYMVTLKRTLDAKGPGLLEMPSGTGKTVTLLSLIVSYKLAHPELGKLVYCSRTVSEIEKVLEEAKVVYGYFVKELGEAWKDQLWLALSSRRNLCIHPRVGEEKDGPSVDAQCRNMTTSFVREQASTDSSIELCGFYEVMSFIFCILIDCRDFNDLA
jgi:DNA excision repair protein ERCC-2